MLTENSTSRLFELCFWSTSPLGVGFLIWADLGVYPTALWFLLIHGLFLMGLVFYGPYVAVWSVYRRAYDSTRTALSTAAGYRALLIFLLLGLGTLILTLLLFPRIAFAVQRYFKPIMFCSAIAIDFLSALPLVNHSYELQKSDLESQ